MPPDGGQPIVGEERPSDLMKRVLFFDREGQQAGANNNSGLRMLDQRWRLHQVRTAAGKGNRYFDEAILVGRAVQTPASAETVSLSSVSPTRLWLGTLPGEGERETLQGFLGQDTYVRIVIPVSRESK